MTTEQKCQVIVTATFNEGGNQSPEFQEYSPKAQAAIEAHGGVVTNRLKTISNAGSGAAPQAILTIEYPTQESAIATFASDEYQSIIPLREVAFKEINILITSPM